MVVVTLVLGKVYKYLQETEKLGDSELPLSASNLSVEKVHETTVKLVAPDIHRCPARLQCSQGLWGDGSEASGREVLSCPLVINR